MVDLTISVVTANNQDLILDCLRSIYAHASGLTLETIVVVNNSADDSAAAIQAQYPQVKLIINTWKKGFTCNHNQAMRASSGRYLLILNDDTVILEGALANMVAFMDQNPRIGILGPKILNPDLTQQWSWGKSTSDRFEYFKSGLLRQFIPFIPCQFESPPRDVSWVTGACLLFRAATAAEIGLFDEHIIIYYEDGDLCYRTLRAGWRVVYYPGAQIIHYHGQTRKQHLARDNFIMYHSRYYFFGKHYHPAVLMLVKVITLLEIAWRCGRISLSNLAPDLKHSLFQSYWQAVKLAFIGRRTGQLGNSRVPRLAPASSVALHPRR